MTGARGLYIKIKPSVYSTMKYVLLRTKNSVVNSSMLMYFACYGLNVAR